MIEAAMKLLYVRDPETGEFKPLIAIKGDQGIQGVGRNAWIRFSAYADGTDYTPTWVDGQFYVGFASSIAEPTDKSEYVWVNLLQVASVFVTSETGQSDRLAISQKTFTESLKNVADNHDAHSEEIAAAEQSIATINGDIKAIKSKNTGQDSSIESLNKKYSDLNYTVNTLKNYINGTVTTRIDQIPDIVTKLDLVAKAVKRIYDSGTDGYYPEW